MVVQDDGHGSSDAVRIGMRPYLIIVWYDRVLLDLVEDGAGQYGGRHCQPHRRKQWAAAMLQMAGFPTHLSAIRSTGQLKMD